MLNTLQEVFRGFFGDQQFSKVVNNDLCFQHTQLVHWVGAPRLFLLRVQPRRVAIYQKEDQNETLVGFAYYQYLELTSQFNHKRYELYDDRRSDLSAVRDEALAQWQWTRQATSRQTYQETQRQLKTQAQRDRQRLQNNHNAWDAFLPNNVLTDVPPHQRRSVALNIRNVFKVSYDPVRFQNRFEPLDFEDKLVNDDIAGRFTRSEESGELSYADEFKLVEDKFKRADNSIVEQVSDEQGAQQLLRLIKAIPKIKFKLTTEQEMMISTPQNLLCLGRSGTGKTTSSALRLFATDAYYKYHEQLTKFKLDNPDKKVRDF